MRSSLLVRAAGLGVSSATVRNVLARLEADGFAERHPRIHRHGARGTRLHVGALVDEGAQHPHPVRRLGSGRREAGKPHPADIAIKTELDVSPLAPILVGLAFENANGLAEQSLIDLFG